MTNHDRLHEVFREHRDDPDRIASILKEVLEDPGAHEIYDVPDLLRELAEIYAEAGRIDEAIATHERAMAAGYEATPDPRMDVSRYLANAGRKEEARRIHEEVAAKSPQDVWFYNAAGLDELDMGDPGRAARWFETGIELCLLHHDPERVLDQLVGLRAEALEALGRPADELQERARRIATLWSYRGPAGIDVWGHFGPGDATTAAVPWFPRDELPDALERWPRLVERYGTSDPGSYVRRLQAHLNDLRPNLEVRPKLAPIAVEGLLEWADEEGFDPETPLARRVRAAELESRGEALEWPPGRNDRCWCGSGRKYKRCCGTVAQRPESRREAEPDEREIPVAYELEVTLLRTEQPPWRRFQITSTATFLDLHRAIQHACGWQDEHLFAFRDVRQRRFAPAPSRLRPAETRETRPTADRVALRSYFSAWDSCRYLYDFGDSWLHEIVVRGRIHPEEPFGCRLVDGERAFPPENCGGISGYHACIEAATGGEVSEERREWLGDWDPEAFDLAAVQARFDR